MPQRSGRNPADQAGGHPGAGSGKPAGQNAQKSHPVHRIDHPLSQQMAEAGERVRVAPAPASSTSGP